MLIQQFLSQSATCCALNGSAHKLYRLSGALPDALDINVKAVNEDLVTVVT